MSYLVTPDNLKDDGYASHQDGHPHRARSTPTGMQACTSLAAGLDSKGLPSVLHPLGLSDRAMATQQGWE